MSKNIFNSVKMTAPKKSLFDLSHDVKLSLNLGNLVPIMCTEVLPGDKFHISAEALIRFQPLTAPVLHRLNCYIHYFFVPNRILWANWENWITNTKIAGSLPAHPTLTFNDVSSAQKLPDYLGLPLLTGLNQYTVSALPFAAYQKIYSEYYRDQNMITDEFEMLADGDNIANITWLTELRKRAWEHDYFTSALPFAQKGDTVDLPLGDVILDPDWAAGVPNPRFEKVAGFPATAGDIQASATPGTESIVSSASTSQPLAYDPAGTLITEPTTINDLRVAFRLQEWLEKMARGGTRMIEVIKSHFNVKSSDARLNRPEWITGTSAPITISEVLNTTGTDDAAQGQMAGHGIGVSQGGHGGYYAEEHGYIIGIMSVMPKTAYQQGIPKHFIKTTDPTELAWPTFANLGEQEVLNKELYVNGATPNGVFGYVPRYAEYKFENNRVAGDMRNSLKFWHFGREFAGQPALNEDFISCNPTTLPFAVITPDADHLIGHVYNKVKVVRALPKYGTPTF